jgi:glycosyltransferase involved in cell wall biosynthesis
MASVSVIVTCYNLERFIGEALQSVLRQSYRDPIEIIVVDDCSTDGSADIIRSFENVRYIRNKRNSGVLLSMIAGIEETRGELIFLLDGDDIWEENKLRLCVERFAADDRLAFVTHDLSFVDGAGSPLARPSRPAQVFAKVRRELEDEVLRRGILLLTDYVWLGSALGLHRTKASLEAFCDYSKKLPDARNTYQDWPLAYWVASLDGAVLGYVPDKLFRYRLHGANHSGDARDVEKALRNMRRTLNTSRAMLTIAEARSLPAAYRRRAVAQTRFFDYLVTLYSGRRLAALGKFIKASGFLWHNRKSAPKELVRLAGICLLGPAGFTTAAKSRSSQAR